jgi:ssRNA-specific RNase YbeY (16S rRNA maturation enzyme)
MLMEIDVNFEFYKWQKSSNELYAIIKIIEKYFCNNFIDSMTQNSIYNIEINFISSYQMKKINYQYRNKDEDTDVLSFSNKFRNDDNILLGQIFISFDGVGNKCLEGYFYSESDILKQKDLNIKKGKNVYFYNFESLFKKKIIILSIPRIIHSICHILGFDHYTEDDCIAMKGFEKILCYFLYKELV